MISPLITTITNSGANNLNITTPTTGALVGTWTNATGVGQEAAFQVWFENCNAAAASITLRIEITDANDNIKAYEADVCTKAKFAAANTTYGYRMMGQVYVPNGYKAKVYAYSTNGSDSSLSYTIYVLDANPVIPTLDAGVVLNATQGSYAPAKAGDAMTLANDALSAAALKTDAVTEIASASAAAVAAAGVGIVIVPVAAQGVVPGTDFCKPVWTITAGEALTYIALTNSTLTETLRWTGNLAEDDLLRIDSDRQTIEKSVDSGATWTSAIAGMTVGDPFPRLKSGVANSVSLTRTPSAGLISLALTYRGAFL
jgi:hypothetical protein